MKFLQVIGSFLSTTTFLAVACTFNTSGLGKSDQRFVFVDASGESGDLLSQDLGVSDQGTADHVTLKDQSAQDQLTTPDTSAPVPIDASTLGQALVNTLVPCIDMQGNDNGTQIPVADSSIVQFFDGAITLANATAPLKSWAGAKPTATVMWDPNACDDEWPLSAGLTWTQAGMLVRGATLNSSGQLVLQPGVTTTDIDILDIYNDGGFEQEVFGPDDAGLTSHPPLVAPVNKAKELIIQLGIAP